MVRLNKFLNPKFSVALPYAPTIYPTKNLLNSKIRYLQQKKQQKQEIQWVYFTLKMKDRMYDD